MSTILLELVGSHGVKSAWVRSSVCVLWAAGGVYRREVKAVCHGDAQVNQK